MKQVSEIPPEILEQFNEVQRRYKEANGTKTAYEVLWEVTRERGDGTKPTSTGRLQTIARDGNTIGFSKPQAADLARDREPERRFNLPLRTVDETTTVNRDQPKDKRKSKIDWDNIN